MQKKLTWKRTIAFLLAAIITASTLGFFALGDPPDPYLWGFTGGGTAHTRFALRNRTNGRVVGTFCMAINIYGIGQTFRRVGQGDMQNYVELSPVAIQEIRYAVALARTMYIGNQFSREFAAQRVPAATLNRPLGPAFVQSLVWTRMAMDNSARFPFPAGSNMPGGWARPGVHPLSVEEVAFWFGHDMVGGQTLAARLSPSDTASIVVTPAFSGTHAPNQDGFIGPFTVNWGASSAQSLIDLAGTPTFSIVQSNLANMVVYDNGDFVPVQYVGIGQEFFVEPRVFGGHDIDLRSNSSIVLSMTEYFFLHGGQPQYGLEFVTWPNQRLRFTREEPNDKFQKSVQEWGTDNPNNWFDHIDVDPDARALFRIVFENTGERDVRLQFSEYPPEDDCCGLGDPGPYPEDERILMRPIPVFNAQQLNDMRLFGRSNIDHILMSDICLCVFENWVPINGFSATLDGNGHTIANLTISENQGNVGLFNSLNIATIHSLNLYNVNFNGVSSRSGALVGALAAGGANRVVINDVHVYRMNVIVENEATFAGFGGLVGYIRGNSTNMHEIQNSSVNDITFTWNGQTPQEAGIGGIVGNISNTNLTNVHVNNMSVYRPAVAQSQWGTVAIGGIVGDVMNVTGGGLMSLSDASVSNIEIINVGIHDSVGGIIGSLARHVLTNVQVRNMFVSTVENNTATFSRTHIGGIAGEVRPSASLGGNAIYDAYVNGFEVVTTGHTNTMLNVGGIAGSFRAFNSEEHIARASVNNLLINIDHRTAIATRLGGIAGHFQSSWGNTITNASASGSIIHSGGVSSGEIFSPHTYAIYAGGIIGRAEASVSIEHAISNVEIFVSAPATPDNVFFVASIVSFMERAFTNPDPGNVRNNVAANILLNNHGIAGSGMHRISSVRGNGWRPPVHLNNIAYENMLLNGAVAANDSQDGDCSNGRSVARAQLYEQATYEELDFDFANTWYMPATGLPRLQDVGIVTFTFPIIDPVGPCQPDDNGGGPGNGAPLVLWVRDYFDGDRLDNDDFLMRVGNSNTFITLREWALQQVADVNAPYHDYVEVDENGDIIRVLVPEGESFTFYYLTKELPVGHFVNIVHIGPPRDSASVTVRERHRARYFYLRVFKYSHSFMDRIAEGWEFSLRRNGTHVATITHNQNNPIRLTEPGLYTLHETQAPPGHVLDPNIIWRFEFTGSDLIAGTLPTIDTDGTVPGGIEITPEGPNVTVRFIEISVINRPYIEPCPESRLTFMKTDDQYRPLAGARFALYRRNSDNTGWERVGGPGDFFTSAPGSGMVTITGMSWDSQYRLVEILAPAGFITPTGYWLITINRSGVMVITAHGDVPEFTMSPDGECYPHLQNQPGETPPRDIEVIKEWNHGDNPVTDQPTYVTVELLANGEPVPSAPYAYTRVVLNAGNNWRHTFTDLPVFDSNDELIEYTVVEINVPTHYTVTYEGQGTNRVVITNTFTRPSTVDFEFTKTNNNGHRLGGAVFALYENIAGVWTRRGDEVTSTNIGVVVFTGLTTDSTYRLVEITAPANHVLPDGHWYVTVEADGTFSFTTYGDAPDFTWRHMGGENTRVLPNERLRTLNFIKTCDNNLPLAGAVFQLYEYIEGNWVARGGTITSADNGQVTITGLREGSRYRLREVSAPDGFETPTGHWYIYVNPQTPTSEGFVIVTYREAPDFVIAPTGAPSAPPIPPRLPNTPETTTPAETTPVETTPAETTPTETTPAETTPAETTPAETTPAETTPAETTPTETTPAETTPAETTPTETTPAETTPAETTPAETTPAETTPTETTSAETTPVETTPAETTPVETTPAETTPAETTPAETTPAETTPAETTPAETTQQQTTPAETTPVETTQQQTTPAETTPAETTPTDTTAQQTTAQQTTSQQTTTQQTTPQQTWPSHTVHPTSPPTPPPTDPPTRVITFPPVTTPMATTPVATTPTTTTPAPTAPIITPAPPTTPSVELIKVPDRDNIRVGESVSWTLRNFHNQRGMAVTDFAIIDLPGVGLYFTSGSLPAFTHGAGVTYDIRFQVAGSSAWHTHATGVNANQPFSFSLPQPGNIYYTAIGFFFGNVPANFGLGNSIIMTFIAGYNAPNNTLVNRFIVTSGGEEREGEGEANVLRPPPTPGPGNHLRPDGNGYLELNNNNVPQGNWNWREGNGWVFTPNTPNVPLGSLPQTGIPGTLWIAVAINLMAIGALSALIIKKRKQARLK